MSTEWDEWHALAVEQGMTVEEANAWADKQTADEGKRSSAASRRGGSSSGGSGGMEGRTPSNPPNPPGGLRRGLAEMIQQAESRPVPKMVVDGLLPTGLTVLAGASKIGKSFMALDIAFAVAAGSPCLGSLVSEPGDVLYLALEDTSTRLRGRLDSLEPSRGGWPWDTLTIYSMDMVGDTGPGWIAETWASSVENPRLVIIDTIARFGGLGERSGYNAEVKWMSKFQDFAVKHDIALLAVTHTNQMKLEEGDDWFNKITGTTGIIGTADIVMLLDVPRGEMEGHLRIEGRDMDATEYAVRKAGPWWQVTSQIRGRRGDLSVAIGDYVVLCGEATTAAVAEQFGISSDKASQYLGRLRRAGVVGNPRRGMWTGATA